MIVVPAAQHKVMVKVVLIRGRAPVLVAICIVHAYNILVFCLHWSGVQLEYPEGYSSIIFAEFGAEDAYEVRPVSPL